MSALEKERDRFIILDFNEIFYGENKIKGFKTFGERESELKLIQNF